MPDQSEKEIALEILQRHWGYSAFRPGQWDIIAQVLEGKDVLAILPTGGGKSLCYQVPALMFEGVTLVISPLIALMQDQVQRLEQSGVKATFINSTLTKREIDQRWTDIEFGRYRLVYMAPERFQNELFLARAERLNIRLVAIDEAHCVSEWGFDFRPAYLNIAESRSLLAGVPFVALTATATPPVREDIIRYLALNNPSVHIKGFDRPNLRWSIFHTQNKQKKVLDVLSGVDGCGVIYAATRRRVEKWKDWLVEQGVEASAYHGGMPHHTRKKAAKEWLSGKTRVMSATNAFGMGIDKSDVRFVIHADMPGALESYYQEAGRAGRDGEVAYAVLLYQETDEETQRGLIEEGHPDQKQLQQIYDTVCVQAGVAFGDQPDLPLTISPLRIATKAGLTPGMVRAGIELLVREGIWSYVPIKRNVAHVRYRQAPANVIRYKEEATNAALASFIETLVRTLHADAYADWWEVNLQQLERKAGIRRDEIYRHMTFLESRELLDWIPPGRQLKIMFLTPRSRRIVLENDLTVKAKTRALRRLDDMLRYTRSESCRRHFLLKFFGESSPEHCGTCDICMGRHEEVVVTPDDEPALDIILQQIQKGSALNDLPAGKVGSQRKIKGLLRWLVQEEYLTQPDILEEKFSLTDKAIQYLKESGIGGPGSRVN